ncbi:MAG: RnfABCDGE type electron transport complex subunit B [Sarcina sp.]
MSILYAALSLGVLGLIFGALLGFASKKFEVKVDERIPKLRECLPGANCGGCGYAGCDAYAEAVVLEGAKATLCSVGGAEVADKIGEVLGVAVEMGDKYTAFVKCNGTCHKAKENFEYEGINSCLEAAALTTKGGKACSYGCLGLASCVKVCEFDAIHIEEGIAKVDKEKCTNCGACINICPKGLIESVPMKKKVRVSCNSKDNGKVVRASCQAGCIGCKICEKACPKSAITVENFLAKVDYDLCVNCKLCTKKCPTKAISDITEVLVNN